MKISELRQIIKEEIKALLKEDAYRHQENLNISDVSDSSIEWDKFAEDLMNKHSLKDNPNFVISGGDYDNPYDYLLPNVTIRDIIDFIKNYH